MNKPPPKSGARPPRRESRPKEQSVYRHPDTQAPQPLSPWQLADPGPRPPHSPRPTRADAAPRPAPASDRARPDRAPRGERERPLPADRGPAYGRERPSAPREREAPVLRQDEDEDADFEVPALLLEREAQRRREVRIYGRAACLAVAEDRFEAIRKLYCTRQRARELGPLLARLAAARIGFNEVEEEDLERLTSSQHHEGVALDILRLPQTTLAELFVGLSQQRGPACLLALEGVGNPHNFGAILRSAVHFGARAVLIPSDSTLTLAGAVYRVAEGAAERVPVLRYPDLAALKGHGFQLIAMTGHGDSRLYQDDLPARSIILFGAEGGGLPRTALQQADARFAIPGSGRVDSLNVAQSVAVVLGEWWRGAQGAAKI